MLGKLFEKKDKGQTEKPESDQLANASIIAFEMLVMKYLELYRIDEQGNSTVNKIELTQKEVEWLDITLKVAGFSENPFLKQLVIEEWTLMKGKNEHLKAVDFSREFVKIYHNSKIEKFAPDHVIERNRKIAEAYSLLLTTIEKIQGWLDDEILRTRILSDFRHKAYVKSTILQCTTPFCIISLGCDEMGRYNLVYSIDYRFQEMISDSFASTLIRRIYEFTPGEMEPFVIIGSLNEDCIQVFEQLKEEAKTIPCHTISIKSKYDI